MRSVAGQKVTSGQFRNTTAQYTTGLEMEKVVANALNLLDVANDDLAAAGVAVLVLMIQIPWCC
jgi:hypothetical protein